MTGQRCCKNDYRGSGKTRVIVGTFPDEGSGKSRGNKKADADCERVTKSKIKCDVKNHVTREVARVVIVSIGKSNGVSCPEVVVAESVACNAIATSEDERRRERDEMKWFLHRSHAHAHPVGYSDLRLSTGRISDACRAW